MILSYTKSSFSQVKTTLSPMELLRLLKAVEKNIGRVTSVRNGPRAIDLDIVLFGERIIDTRTLDMQKPEHESLEGCLIVPHPKMSEREFVLRPLQE
jgi:dihydroneopterin aldolase/2-amino-4-hydroxy-6-hydroxymethyldihydropteridine diphosphokinase/dihydropteroate synthase